MIVSQETDAQPGNNPDRQFRDCVNALTDEADSTEFARFGVFDGTYPATHSLPIPAGIKISRVVLSVERILDVPTPTTSASENGELAEFEAATVVDEIDTGARLWTITWKDEDGLVVLRIARTAKDWFTFCDGDECEREVHASEVEESLNAIVGELTYLVNTNVLAPASEEQVEDEMAGGLAGAVDADEPIPFLVGSLGL